MDTPHVGNVPDPNEKAALDQKERQMWSCLRTGAYSGVIAGIASSIAILTTIGIVWSMILGQARRPSPVPQYDPRVAGIGRIQCHLVFLFPFLSNIEWEK